jgi:hypothetical protein
MWESPSAAHTGAPTYKRLCRWHIRDVQSYVLELAVASSRLFFSCIETMTIVTQFQSGDQVRMRPPIPCFACMGDVLNLHCMQTCYTLFVPAQMAVRFTCLRWLQDLQLHASERNHQNIYVLVNPLLYMKSHLYIQG